MPGNELAPPLVLGEFKYVFETYTCQCGEVHCNVGPLQKGGSVYNFYTCYKCREVLPLKGTVDWCHSSRFKSVE
jgi:hypothetical protein